MFKKEKTEETPEPQTPKKPQDETAYEDSWYRSLKAMADRDEDTDDEQVGVPED